ncbi:MAG: FlgD immunoglobulin-like domain containing protein [bacterium]
MSLAPRPLAVFPLASAVLLALALSASPSAATPGDFLWSRGWDASGHAALDATGATGTAGTFFGSINLGGGNILAGNFVGGDVFIARYGPAGGFAWGRTFTPTMNGVVVQAAAVDPAGDLYVGGKIVTGGINFGGGVLGGAGQMWIVKFDPAGNFLWSDTYGPGDIADLSASAAGVAVTGNFNGTIDFGGGPIVAVGGADAFVAVFDPNGVQQWSAGFGDGANQAGKCVVLSATGGVGLSGTMQGTVDFGGGPLTAVATDLFLARFNASGAHVFSRDMPGAFGPGADIETDLALSGGNVVALCGTLFGPTNFGTGFLPVLGASDAFLVLYDASGNLLWSKSYGGVGADTGQGVQFDAGGNVVLTGSFENAINFGGGAIPAIGGTDLFVAGVSGTGVYVWSRGYGTPNPDDVCRASTDPLGTVLLFGAAANLINFGGGNLADGQFYVARIKALSAPVAAPVVASAAAAVRCAPNPFRDATSLTFASPRAAAGPVTIHDVAGRCVRTLRTDGDASLVWDGRDARGLAVPAGVYYWRLGSGADTRTGSIVRVR